MSLSSVTNIVFPAKKLGVICVVAFTVRLAAVPLLKDMLNVTAVPLLENPHPLTSQIRFELTKNRLGNQSFSWSATTGFRWSI
ncbi:MAG: hypothetical protein SGI96_11560 [Bacteroidota bacterium]|nr:hypothetical protein [Bacteroidota bacterium]